MKYFIEFDAVQLGREIEGERIVVSSSIELVYGQAVDEICEILEIDAADLEITSIVLAKREG